MWLTSKIIKACFNNFELAVLTSKRFIKILTDIKAIYIYINIFQNLWQIDNYISKYIDELILIVPLYLLSSKCFMINLINWY